MAVRRGSRGHGNPTPCGPGRGHAAHCRRDNPDSPVGFPDHRCGLRAVVPRRYQGRPRIASVAPTAPSWSSAQGAPARADTRPRVASSAIASGIHLATTTGFRNADAPAPASPPTRRRARPARPWQGRRRARSRTAGRPPLRTACRTRPLDAAVVTGQLLEALDAVVWDGLVTGSPAHPVGDVARVLRRLVSAGAEATEEDYFPLYSLGTAGWAGVAAGADDPAGTTRLVQPIR